MLPYLHILIRVEDDGSLHAMGAFTSKEKQAKYQKEAGLDDEQVRLDFYNGPFDEDIDVIYAGHRRWNMDRFQLGGYFKSEGEAWNWVTQEGYVSVLRIDTSYETEKQFEKKALELYAKLQKRWRLAPYQNMVSLEGEEKARANLTLRFYQDTLESFKPKTSRDIRALYAFLVLAILLPVAIYFYLNSGPDYGINAPGVKWLPESASEVSYYRSKQVQVYEFRISPEDFRIWAREKGMDVRTVTRPQLISRYKAYIPSPDFTPDNPNLLEDGISIESFQNWQKQISILVTSGMMASGQEEEIAVYDKESQKAYYEKLRVF